MGGEKPSRKVLGFCTVGSPPHGRGKGLAFFLVRSCTGITPAWAGKSRMIVERYPNY